MISADVLGDYMVRVLRAVGCGADNAKIAAQVFLEADMRGVSFQGLDHMHTLISGIRNGHVDPEGRPRIAKEGDAFALIDGHRGPGQPAAMLAADVAIAKARRCGTSCVGITNSSDIFMIGVYAEKIARAGMVGFVFTGAPPRVHPHGGRERILGTNPFAIAFPTEEKNPLLIDLATSAVSNSFVRQAAYYGEELPDGVAFDADGKPTKSAKAVRSGGSIAPLAEHKGFALALAVGLLAGPLVGAQVGKAMNGWRNNKEAQGTYGHFLIAINPSCFGDAHAFSAAVSAYLREITSSQKAADVSEIRTLGARSFRTRERSLREGVRIYDAVWENFAVLARDLNVSVPDVEEATSPAI
jgi:LDH2 family malate/lactate/ureidoglycolate dehydrogenase